MKIRFAILILIISALAFSCKSDVKDSGSELINEENSTENMARSLEGIAPQPEGQQVYRVSIGVKPDISHQGNGVKVGEVVEGRPGAKAGIMTGDLILELDGMEVPGLSQYTMYMSQFKSGESVEMTILRGGKNIKTKVYFD